MTGTPTAPPVLVSYDPTGYPMLPATPPVPRVPRPAGDSGQPLRTSKVTSLLSAVREQLE